MNIFTPFIQKYLLQEKDLSSKTNGHYLLLVDGLNLNYHWGDSGVIRDEKLYIEINRDFERLVNEEFQLYSVLTDCIVTEQPTWDMNESVETSPRDWKRNDIDKLIIDDKELCHGWRMESCAYYSPAHTNVPDHYGIHITKRGIAKITNDIHQLCLGNTPRDIVLLATVYKLFVHELCHAFIEEICCLIDFSSCETRPKQERNYAKVQRHYNGYIFMEEAICNTYAYGGLYQFLLSNDHSEKPLIPKFDPQITLNAFKDWMKKQPKGYRDFLEITERPDESKIFIKYICRLLVEVYGFDLHHVGEAVGAFFDVQLYLYSDFDCHDRKINYSHSFWYKNKPPLHVEF